MSDTPKIGETYRSNRGTGPYFVRVLAVDDRRVTLLYVKPNRRPRSARMFKLSRPFFENGSGWRLCDPALAGGGAPMTDPRGVPSGG